MAIEASLMDTNRPRMNARMTMEDDITSGFGYSNLAPDLSAHSIAKGVIDSVLKKTAVDKALVDAITEAIKGKLVAQETALGGTRISIPGSSIDSLIEEITTRVLASSIKEQILSQVSKELSELMKKTQTPDATRRRDGTEAFKDYQDARERWAGIDNTSYTLGSYAGSTSTSSYGDTYAILF